MKAADAEGMNHAVRAAGQHHDRLRRCESFRPIRQSAWLLEAHAAMQLAFGPWALNQAAKWAAGMFNSSSNSSVSVRHRRRPLGKSFRTEFVAVHRSGHHLRELIPILIRFAAAQVDAEAQWIESVRHRAIGARFL